MKERQDGVKRDEADKIIQTSMLAITKAICVRVKAIDRVTE